MRRTRVLLAHMSTLLAGVITDILKRESDMEVLPSLNVDADVAGAVRREGIDVVIAGLDAGEFSAEADELFGANPRLCVLGVENDGRQTTLYELRPHHARLGELSPAELVTVIRDFPERWQAGIDEFVPETE